MFLRKGMSVEYLIPGVVVKYIQRHGLCEFSPSSRSPALFTARSELITASSCPRSRRRQAPRLQLIRAQLARARRAARPARHSVVERAGWPVDIVTSEG
jgi:hypothetical protein